MFMAEIPERQKGIEEQRVRKHTHTHTHKEALSACQFFSYSTITTTTVPRWRLKRKHGSNDNKNSLQYPVLLSFLLLYPVANQTTGKTQPREQRIVLLIHNQAKY